MKKLLPFALVGLAVIVSVCAAVQVLMVEPIRSRILEEEAQVRSKIAAEYGVADDWPSARYAIYCIVFRSGRSMSDLESELTRLGKWTRAGSLDTKIYTLVGLTVGSERFRIHAVFVNGTITQVSVIENWEQSDSDAQPITCRTGSYTFTYEDIQTPRP